MVRGVLGAPEQDGARPLLAALAVEQNFAGNALSMYSGKSPPFQIHVNFGLWGAVLAMLVVDTEEAGARARTVMVGPAIPASSGGGE